MKNTLTKKERLASRNLIEELFSSGQSFCIYPFRVIHYYSQCESPGVRVLFTVPKKKFRKAVDRNRIKRLCRESYRIQKHELLEKNITGSFCLNVGFVYTGSQADISLDDIHAAMQQALHRLVAITDTRGAKPEC